MLTDCAKSTPWLQDSYEAYDNWPHASKAGSKASVECGSARLAGVEGGGMRATLKELFLYHQPETVKVLPVQIPCDSSKEPDCSGFCSRKKILSQKLLGRIWVKNCCKFEAVLRFHIDCQHTALWHIALLAISMFEAMLQFHINFANKPHEVIQHFLFLEYYMTIHMFDPGEAILQRALWPDGPRQKAWLQCEAVRGALPSRQRVVGGKQAIPKKCEIAMEGRFLCRKKISQEICFW